MTAEGAGEAPDGFEVETEWRVDGMDGPHARTSNTYPEKDFALRIQAARGGVVQHRRVAVTKWEAEP